MNAEFWTAARKIFGGALTQAQVNGIETILAASEGLPIAGDDKYGDFEVNKTLSRIAGVGGLKRMFLHAWRLQFTHPATGKRIELKSNLPPELQIYVNHVKSKSSPPSV